MTTSPPRSDTAILLVCVTVLVCVVVTASALVYVFAPSGTDLPSLTTTLVGALAPTIAAMVAVIKVGGVANQVADVAEDTNKLANGMGDAKIRAAVADVLPDHLIDTGAKPQLEADRLRRALPEEHR